MSASQSNPEAPTVEGDPVILNATQDPSVNIISDIELVLNIIKQLKAILSDKHPSILQIVKAIFSA